MYLFAKKKITKLILHIKKRKNSPGRNIKFQDNQRRKDGTTFTLTFSV